MGLPDGRETPEGEADGQSAGLGLFVLACYAFTGPLPAGREDVARTVISKCLLAEIEVIKERVCGVGVS